MTPTKMTAHFFLALAVTLLGCRLLQVVGSRLGQSSVVAEMVGGILLAPPRAAQAATFRRSRIRIDAPQARRINGGLMLLAAPRRYSSGGRPPERVGADGERLSGLTKPGVESTFRRKLAASGALPQTAR